MSLNFFRIKSKKTEEDAANLIRLRLRLRLLGFFNVVTNYINIGKNLS